MKQININDNFLISLPFHFIKKKINVFFYNLIFFSILFLIFFTPGCSKNSTSGENTVIFNLQDTPKTIDPQLTTSTTGLQIDSICMEGLLRLGKKTGEIYPAGAKSWETGKNGKIWTFYLRKNAKWSNGDPVTANDYIFGLKRALSAQTGAQYAYMLFCIKNAEKYANGKIKDFNKIGIKALNKHTLQIILNRPVPYFEQILTFSITYPVNKTFYQKKRDKFGLNKKSLLYNGPYIIKKWIPNGKIVFKKNPHYWNSENIKINTLSCPMIRNYNTAANMYLNSELDITNLSGDQLPMFKNRKCLRKIPDSVWFLQFNTKNKYLRNTKIRRAIALAVNRTIFCKNIRKDGSIPAYSFVLPDINGGTVDGERVSFRERYSKPLFNENIKLARKLFSLGLKELGIKKLPTIRLLTSNNSDSRRDGQYIQEELHKNLGINIQLNPNTLQSRLQKTDRMDYEIVYRNWLPDYNDPNNFLDIWISNGPNSHTGWKNERYDKLIEKAAKTIDNNKRMLLLHKAEKLLMEKMPVAPLFFRTNNWAVRPDIKNLVIRGFGVQVSFIWAKLNN
ncbi:MAG: peptide ABC transporter substrate-binding protein [Victivallales bacterium]|nr:peptide ABC transporter substrate-binding protein [Victivallales bacterium]MCF7888584.1 peptide ABC transporter substrate-binding protein [Victivallales bacterium]